MAEPTLDELVEYVRTYYLKDNTEEGLAKFVESHYWPQACGCMGPQNGWTVCDCKMSNLVDKYKLQIVAKLDEALALKLLRMRIIQALTF